jgi:hypothetical protein
MTIETKKNIGDNIWFLHNNKALVKSINQINIEIKPDSSIEEKYFVNINEDIKNSLYECKIIYPSSIFETREDLINSL